MKNGDIAELLLRDGFAKCADWSIRNVVGGPAKLRAAEAQAKEQKKKIWTNFVSKAQVVRSASCVDYCERFLKTVIVLLIQFEFFDVGFPADSRVGQAVFGQGYRDCRG